MKSKIKIGIAVCIYCICLFGSTILVSAAGTLSVALSSSTVKAGETVTVTVSAAGEDGGEVTSDLTITYDTSKLEYISSSLDNATWGNGTVKASGSGISIKFKASASGDAYVKAEGVALTAAGAHITVSGAASDDSEEREESGTVQSGDNSLSSLTISPGSLTPAFKGSVTEYTAQVGSDVNEVTVTPVTSNSKATVESITGNKDLVEGNNIVKILVKAENGTEASYKITVKKGGTTPASSDNVGNAGNAGSAGIADITADQIPENTEDTPSVTPDADAIDIDGVSYKISGDFSDELIPEGFSRADFEYKGKPYRGVVFDSGHLGMYYMLNDAGEGRFFVYDADRDKFYPYLRLTNGEHFIILMVVPNGAIPPYNYQETALSIEGISIAAYQYAGDPDAEIVKPESGEEGMAPSGKSDFYLIYGMDNTGTSGWYQYDSKQSIYQRLNAEAMATDDSGEQYNALVESYNELSERHKTTKAKDRRLIAVLIFISVVLVIILLNMILKLRDARMDDEDEEEGYIRRRPVREKRTRPSKKVRQTHPKRTHTGRNAYPVVKEPKENTDFYDDDDEDFMEEFEDTPTLLSRKPRQKAQPARPSVQEPPRPVAKQPENKLPDNDDDIEFLDLNDL